MASDLDPCPHCGRDDFGNAGARSQHVSSCGETAKKYQKETQTEAKEPQIEPAQPDTQPPARQQQGDDIAKAGEQMAGGLASTLDEDAPIEERKSGVKKLTSLLGGALTGVMEQREQKAQQEEQRAQNANLQEATDKPQCECGLTFSRIPRNADRISCPECGREYVVK